MSHSCTAFGVCVCVCVCTCARIGVCVHSPVLLCGPLKLHALLSGLSSQHAHLEVRFKTAINIECGGEREKKKKKE